ncbi:hypothetical protein MW290_18895 [Aquincola tertiaricarbonis]|uniref:Uncharacterized protein n=1 Tax=Aquincola tertiaricarbonis TaxID=391953 RepID=A0ABY4SDI8_AQUTE|nr:hypothetical protein [Aquincola tertiaricarbonis]URI11038.1 hypothetical protein MW290_18895 [Aquincola tertiaricarbonis]
MSRPYTSTAVRLDVLSAKDAHRTWLKLRAAGHHAAAAAARNLRDCAMRAARAKVNGGAA